MKKKYLLNEIESIKIDLQIPTIIFLKGDLGAGKTTISKHIINNLFGIKDIVTSPTYTYYNKYIGENNLQIYHFDLYRLKDYDTFFSIGGEDILDNNNGIVLIEWPDLIEKYYKPNIEIIINKTDKDDEREVEIKYN